MEQSNRPWGSYRVIEDAPTHKVKHIQVNPNQRLSYQSHKFRAEQWTIVKGEAIVIIDDIEKRLTYGESIHIPLGAKHRILNPSNDQLIFIEVQTGSYFGEDDIIRYQDDYNRN